MVLDQECPHREGKKSSQEDDKKEERHFLPKKLYSLKKRSEFIFIRNAGASKQGNYFILNYYITDFEEIKFGLTVSKKMGNAVKRNYIKRVLRSLIKKNFNLIPKKVNFEIIPKKKIESVKFLELERDLNKLFMQLVS